MLTKFSSNAKEMRLLLHYLVRQQNLFRLFIIMIIIVVINYAKR